MVRGGERMWNGGDLERALKQVFLHGWRAHAANICNRPLERQSHGADLDVMKRHPTSAVHSCDVTSWWQRLAAIQTIYKQLRYHHVHRLPQASS